MDALKIETISALEKVITAVECIVACRITQDTEKEELHIFDIDLGRKTIMNCSCNSVGATIKQVCNHINKGSLFSYDPEYRIGM